jgi:hypothetical protein
MQLSKLTSIGSLTVSPVSFPVRLTDKERSWMLYKVTDKTTNRLVSLVIKCVPSNREIPMPNPLFSFAYNASSNGRIRGKFHPPSWYHQSPYNASAQSGHYACLLHSRRTARKLRSTHPQPDRVWIRIYSVFTFSFLTSMFDLQRYRRGPEVSRYSNFLY